MTYEEILERAPKSYQAGDCQAAAAFVQVLMMATVLGRENDPLTDAQRVYISRLRGRWQARAEGRDVRWNVHGSRPGRSATKTTTARAGGRSSRPDPGEQDPLFVSLMRKYGQPKP